MKKIKIKMNHIAAIAMALSAAFIMSFTTGGGPAAAKSATTPKSGGYRELPNDAFTYGERLQYDVVYSFIKAGEGYFYVYPKPAYINGRKSYDIRFQVRSLKSLEFLYKVRDAYRTIMDEEGLFPWRFEQKIREGNYKKDFSAKFDQKNKKAIVGDKKYEVPKYVHDIVSAFYYVRTMDLSSMKKGSVFYLKNFFDKETYNLGVKIHGKQTVEVKAGKFDCIVIEPQVVEGGLFKSEGNIYIWVTDDENKMPVKVSAKIAIGSVDAELTKYSNVKNPLTSKK